MLYSRLSIPRSPLAVHRLLEVGALKPDNYAACGSWLDVTPIDLRSRHPLIREQDFLEMDAEENEAKWDIISLSLVVNFVPERKDRGEYTPLCSRSHPYRAAYLNNDIWLCVVMIL